MTISRNTSGGVDLSELKPVEGELVIQFSPKLCTIILTLHQAKILAQPTLIGLFKSLHSRS